MRKLLVFSMFMAGFAISGFDAIAAGCEKRSLGWADMASKDEYIYQNSSEYNVKRAFECGNDHCPDTQMIFMGMGHYHNGKEVKKNMIYTCKGRGDQMWSEYKVGQLAECSKVQCNATVSAAEIDGWYVMDKIDGNSGLERQSGLQLLIQSETSVCRCKEIGKEEILPQPQPQPQPRPGPGPVPGIIRCTYNNSVYDLGKKADCKSEIANSLVAYRTCLNTQQMSSCVLEKCDEDNGFIATQDNRCIKEGDSTTGPVKPTDCTEEHKKFLKEIADKYPNTQTGRDALVLLQYCNGGSGTKITEDNFSISITAVYKWVSDHEKALTEEQGRQSAQQAATNSARIKDIVAQIEKSGKDNATVWRNADGGFNTSRLISDSIAGVALGTAGGLITSHVIKKNQIENGFEEMMCTIGGQMVAGWDDEFRVGIQ